MIPGTARLLALWDEVRSSYWFIPSLMTVGAAVLSFVLVGVDGRIGGGWIESVPYLFANRPDGARAVLSTLAGSMIGVAGVTFSITIASVVYATGQYGPRLLTNFMRDRGNQVTLGTFIATFLYCLLVLRTIRSAGEEGGAEFVPHVAMLGGLGLAVASVGVLIYFIHHVPESIHASNLIAGVGKALAAQVETLFPERIGEGERPAPDVEAALPAGFALGATVVRAPGSGYVTGVDAEALLRVASEGGLVVRVRRRPGDFVAEGDALLAVWPARALSDDARAALAEAFAWGRQRTDRQDVRFLANELVEIAGRALSPGVNDPFTAISCLDWLAAALKTLTERAAPDPLRRDADGTVRVIAHPTTFEDFADAIYGQLRPYLAADRNAALYALRTLAEVGGRARLDRQRAVLRRHADALAEGAAAVLAVPADREAVARAHRDAVRVLSGLESLAAAAERSDAVGGTG